MARWSPHARTRLEQAASDLFAEQGFAATTVPEIAARAGLTTRTFFRHFADKREVIFAGDEIPAYAAQLLWEAPASLTPTAVLVHGLRQVAESRFDGRRDDVRRVRALIASDDGLQERDLRKRAALVSVIRAGFLDRGTDALEATVLAETAVLALHVALDQWLDDVEDRPLFPYVLQVLTMVSEMSLVT